MFPIRSVVTAEQQFFRIADNSKKAIEKHEEEEAKERFLFLLVDSLQ